MNIDPAELRTKRLAHPPEKVKLPGRGFRVLFRLLSIGALALGLGLVFFLMKMNEEYEIRGKELSDQLAELRSMLSVIGGRLDEEHQSISALGADVKLVQKRIGLTQNEIKRARAVAEQIRKEQEEDVQALTNQILHKADSQEVVALDEKSEVKFQEIDEQITVVQEEVKTSQEELEKTWKELAAMGLRVSEQGRLIATSGDALEELKRRGEREYLEFDARKKKKLTVGNLVIELRKADRKNHRADLRLYYDDKRVDRKQVYTNTPLIFYIGRDNVQYELVINQVTKDRITGYISAPIGKLPKSAGLTVKTAT